MLKGLFRPRPAKAAGEKLYHSAMAQSRRPEFYTTYGVADEIDARFEMAALHLVLLMHRLKGQGEEAQEVSQAAFDTLVDQLDATLRELGVGDLTVPKKMRKLGETFYARVKAYDDAFGAEDDQPLRILLARVVYDDAVEAPERADALARYVETSRDALAAQPLERVLKGAPQWSNP